jgi:hypothetical protein
MGRELQNINFAFMKWHKKTGTYFRIRLHLQGEDNGEWSRGKSLQDANKDMKLSL